LTDSVAFRDVQDDSSVDGAVIVDRRAINSRVPSDKRGGEGIHCILITIDEGTTNVRRRRNACASEHQHDHGRESWSAHQSGPACLTQRKRSINSVTVVRAPSPESACSFAHTVVPCSNVRRDLAAVIQLQAPRIISDPVLRSLQMWLRWLIGRDHTV
jgi:hypothetical protein